MSQPDQIADLTPQRVEQCFTRSDGTYLFARWGRPIAPIAFGIQDDTLSILKGAIEAICTMVGHQVAETDPELGSNLMFFFFREWAELIAVPDLDKLVPDLAPLVDRLTAADANQYRFFRFDDDGGIKACFVFIRMDDDMAGVPADTLCLSQVVQSFLLWSDRAFTDRAALAKTPQGHVILRPDIAEIIRAAYDPVLPSMARDPSHALRLFARVGQLRQSERVQ